MKIVFKNEPPHLPEPDPRRDRSAGVPPLPEHVLDRHRARVLRPGDASLASGAPTPSGTVYRYNRVLMCDRLLGNDAQLSELDAALAVQGMQVNRERVAVPEQGRRMHRAALQLGQRATPGQVDAWHVLQTLRGAVDGGRCGQEVLSRMRLEHLLVGSALQGAGGAWAATSPGGAPGHGGSPGGGPSSSLSYLNRMPVDTVLPLPQRRPLSAMPGGRRPVVAVLDTGVAQGHPDLEAADRHDDRDAFVEVDAELQDRLAAEADPEAPRLDGPWEDQVSDDTLTGAMASHFGHGTFIAGIIRQVAPDARVRSIRVMHNDGVAYEHETLAALAELADEVERARAGDDTADPVDLVSLSFGYVDEDPEDKVHGALAAAVRRLTQLGVPVIAAAGNFAVDRPFYPAAFGAHPQPPEAAPVLGVAALNPNGTVAMYSNDGPWVSCYAAGTAVMSTFPNCADGSLSPAMSDVDGHRRRESLDPDDFRSGYATWSGTSFAAPLLAGKLAAAMTEDPAQDLAALDAAAVAQRVQWALKVVGG